MAKMRTLLSAVDPARISVGEVVYPPGGRLGPRRQDDLQLVLVHRGSATIAIDDGPPVTHGEGTVALLLPGHREEFAFARDEPTRHSWVQARVGPAPDGFAALPRALPLSGALADLVRRGGRGHPHAARDRPAAARRVGRRGAVALRRRGRVRPGARRRRRRPRAPPRPRPRRRRGPRPVPARPRRPRQPTAPRPPLPRRARHHPDGVPVAPPRRPRGRPARPTPACPSATSPPARASSRSTTSRGA